jgi:hypothetical protein
MSNPDLDLLARLCLGDEDEPPIMRTLDYDDGTLSAIMQANRQAARLAETLEDEP